MFLDVQLVLSKRSEQKVHRPAENWVTQQVRLRMKVSMLCLPARHAVPCEPNRAAWASRSDHVLPQNRLAFAFYVRMDGE